jgi:hypothetical protein
MIAVITTVVVTATAEIDATSAAAIGLDHAGGNRQQGAGKNNKQS